MAIHDSAILLLKYTYQRCARMWIAALFVNGSKVGNNIHEDENEYMVYVILMQ